MDRDSYEMMLTLQNIKDRHNRRFKRRENMADNIKRTSSEIKGLIGQLNRLKRSIETRLTQV